MEDKRKCGDSEEVIKFIAMKKFVTFITKFTKLRIKHATDFFWNFRLHVSGCAKCRKEVGDKECDKHAISEVHIRVQRVIGKREEINKTEKIAMLEALYE